MPKFTDAIINLYVLSYGKETAGAADGAGAPRAFSESLVKYRYHDHPPSPPATGERWNLCENEPTTMLPEAEEKKKKSENETKSAN